MALLQLSYQASQMLHPHNLQHRSCKAARILMQIE
jgi:hypothetical protein